MKPFACSNGQPWVGKSASRRALRCGLSVLVGLLVPMHATAGGLLREVWTGLSGNELSLLTNSVDFPSRPSFTNYVTDLFEAPVNFDENYGQRLHGYLVPPKTGNYTFWIATDDNGALWLSTDDSPARARVVAAVSGWAGSREWEKEAGQRSEPISLIAGKAYYVAALNKEGGGGDNLAVRWLMPDGTDQAPIVATNLLPWGTTFSPPAIAQHPADTSAVEGTTATFSVTLSTIGLADYYWRKGGAILPGTGTPELGYGPVRMSDQGALFDCIISNRLGAVTSRVARLTVQRDLTPPALSAVQNIGATNLLVSFSEPVEPVSALDPARYGIGPGIGVLDADFAADQRTVMLLTTPLTYGADYRLTVSGVRDQADQPNTIAAGAAVDFLAVEYAPAGIGSPAVAGSSRPVAGGFDVVGAGTGIGERADQFQFAYQFRTGDFDVQTRLEGLEPTDAWAQAGLMVRESLTNRSRFAAILASPGSGGCSWMVRTAPGGVVTMSGSHPVNHPATWLRLKRVGSTFSGYGSLDGLEWRSLGTASLTLPQTVYFGLAVSGRLEDRATTARFRDIGPAQGVITTAPLLTGEPLAPSSRRTRIAISEIMYHPAARTDGRDLEFIELYNGGPVFEELGGWRLSGSIEYEFPPGTVLPAEGFLVVARTPADVMAVHGISGVIGGFTNRLENGSGTVRLENTAGAVLLEAAYSGGAPWPAAADGAGHSLVLARPSYGEGNPRAWAASAVKGGSPGRNEPLLPAPEAGVVFNEFLAHTDPPQLDFVELLNGATRSVDLSGCWLSDDPATNRFRIPDGTVLAPGDLVAFDELQLGFRLDAAGETVLLVSADGSRVIDAVPFGPQENGVSTGRTDSGFDAFRRLAHPTPGQANAPRRLEEVVINEIMYHPLPDAEDGEYVELHNRSAAAVDLGGWRFTDGVDFVFPEGAVLPAGGFAVVAQNLAHLRAAHPGLSPALAFGDFSGALANGGERLALAKPDLLVSTNAIGEVEERRVFIDVAEVTWLDGGRWGRWTDGGGSSLELVDPDADPRLAASWAGSDETGKAPWTEISVTGRLEHGNTEARFTPDRLFVLMAEAGECLLDEIEVFAPGGTNLVANGGFESGALNRPGGWSFFGNHSTSTGDTNAPFAGTRALRLRAQSEGDTGPNSLRTPLAAGLTPGGTGTIRARVRWLAGWPEILLRTRGNWLELAGRMQVPADPGTPGQPNSRLVPNAGPAIHDVAHFPPVPRANEAVLVTCRVSDPDGLASVLLRSRIDPSSSLTTTAMRDDGSGGDAVAGDGVWSARLTGRGAGTLVAFRIEATDAAGAPAAAVFPADAPAAECLVRWGDALPAGNLPHYHLWHTAAVGTARSSSSGLDNTYRDCTLVYGNWRVIYNAGFRDKGSPWHGGVGDIALTVPPDDLLLGTRDRAFASTGNGGSEETGIRSQLAMWLGQELDIPFLGARYMRLYVNGGEFRNVLEDLEVPSREYARARVGGGDDLDLYKLAFWFEFEDNNASFGPIGATLEKFTGSDGGYKLPRYRWCWQQRFSGPTANNLTNLFTLIEAVNTPAVSNFVQRTSLLADIDQWMRVLAYNRILGNWDSWGYGGGQNMYAAKPGPERWVLLPWDIDFIFGLGGGAGEALWGGGDPVLNRMYDTPAFRRALWRAYQQAVDGPLLPDRYGPQIDARRRYLVANAVSGVSDPRPIRDYLEARRRNIQSQLQANDTAAFLITSNNGNDFTSTRPLAVVTGRAPFAVAAIAVNGTAQPVEWTDQNTYSLYVPLSQRTTVLDLAGLDRHGRPVPGATDRVTVTYTGTVESPADFIAINEIHYHPAAPGTAFVELHNRSTLTTFDLSHWRLEGTGLSFAEGTSLGPRGFLLAVADLPAFTAAFGVAKPVAGVFPGQLDNGGETLRLVQPGAAPAQDQVIDEVRYDDDPPWPPAADGAGPSLQLIDAAQDNTRVANWTAAATNAAVLSTPGALNSLRQTLPVFPPVWINEVSPRNRQLADGAGDRDPWIELYNDGPDALDLGALHLTDSYTNLARWSFPLGTVLPAQSFLVVWTDGEPGESRPGELHTSFRLDPDRGAVALSWSAGGSPGVLDHVDYDTLGDGQTWGSFPDGRVRRHRRLYHPTPAAPNSPEVPVLQVFFNEWMASNASALRDPSDNDADDWFELFNAGAAPADLSGYTLTDDLAAPARFRIPAGTIIPAGGRLLAWADEETGQTNVFGDLHVNFRLGQAGESLGLYDPNTNAVDTVQFGAQVTDVSEGRWPDGSAPPFVAFTTPSPRGPNTTQGNLPPVLAPIGDQAVREGEPLAFTAKATDPDGPATSLRYSLVSAPAGAAIHAGTGVFSWTPNEAQGPGTYRFTVKVSDQGSPARHDFETITVSVLEANRPPVPPALADVTVDEGAPVQFTATATDPDEPANALRWELGPGAPPAASIDPATGAFFWRPGELDGPGTHVITLRVVDDGSPNLAADTSFRVSVREIDNPPVFGQMPERVTDEGVTLRFVILAADPDSPPKPLRFELGPDAPLGAAVDPATGEFSWTPGEIYGPGLHTIPVRVTENTAGGRSTQGSFFVRVREVNRPPLLDPLAPQTVAEGGTAVFRPRAGDPDLPAQGLTYSTEAPLPGGVTLDSATGAVLWKTGDESGPASHEFTLRVSDDGSPVLSASQPVRLIVERRTHLVINEVLHRTAVTGSEFIELHNPSSSRTESLAGVRLTGTQLRFDFPPGLTLGPGGFLVVVRDPAAFATGHPGAPGSAGTWTGSLGSTRDRLALERVAPDGSTVIEVMDRMEYDTVAPWPGASLAAGQSLQRIDARQDGTRPGSWAPAASLPPGQSRQLLAFTSPWRYHQSGTDLGTAWRAPEYHDTAWPQGGGLLFVESAALPAPKTTPLTIGPMTFYFRTRFSYAGPTLGISLKLTTIIDDGAVFYLNGRRLHGLFMPEDPFDAATPAQRTVGDAAIEGPFTVSAEALRVGENVLAVEVHQASPGSTDVVLGAALELEGGNLPPATPGQPNPVARPLPAFPSLWLNEVQPAGGALADAAGEREPWIELFNPGPLPVLLDGWTLTANPATLDAWAFPTGRSLEPGQALLLWADAEPGEGGGDEIHLPFRLDAATGNVTLGWRTGGQPVVLDHLPWNTLPTGSSLGSLPDGQRWTREVLPVPSPGQSNQAPPAATPDLLGWERHADGSLTLTWRSTAGYTYTLETTDRLVGGAWQALGTLGASGNETSATDLRAASPGERYYRVRVGP